MKDEIIPEGNWKFDSAVADVFPDMLKRSIPNYEWMRESTALVLQNIVRPLNILDIGCSDGQQYEFIKNHPRIDINYYLGLDISEPMLEVARNKHSGDESSEWFNFDLRNSLPNFDSKFDVILSILTMQFIPIEYRPALIGEIYENLVEDGMFIFIEKVFIQNYVGQQSMINSYYSMKYNNGYSLEAIEKKRDSLENVLFPLSSESNEQMMRDAGFIPVKFWQSFNFCGWVAFKKNTPY